MVRNVIVAVAVVAAGLAVGGCRPDTAGDRVAGSFDECARSDLFGPRITRFGASNNAGAGTMYRARPNGGYDLWFSQQTLNEPPYDLDGAPNRIRRHNVAGCTVQSNRTGSMNLGAGVVTTAVKGISGDVAAAFENAESVVIEPTTFSIEEIEGGPFLAWVRSLPADNDYRTSLSKQGFVIMTRAIRVNRLNATVTIKQGASADVAGKFEPAGEDIVNANATFNVKRTGDRTVQITSDEAFYIAGELSRFDPTAMAGGNPFQPVGMVDLSKEARPQ